MANEAQREYWNGAPGQRWVALQETFDRGFVEITELLLARAEIRSNESGLDVGCGSGASTLEAARRVAPEGRVLGVDISEPLVNLARERARRSGLRNLDFLLADAQSHGFAPGLFDFMLSRMGVMFFDAPAAAFRNIRGALKPGGRLCFVCWAGIEKNPWFEMPLATGVRRLGKPEPQPAHAPGPMAFSDPQRVRGVLGTAGFSRVGIEEAQPFILGHATAEEEAAFTTVAGPLARLLVEKKPEATVRDELVREIAESFRPFVTDKGVRTPATVYYVTAARH